MGNTIIKITDASFQKEIEKGVTLVDCYADWCGPCKRLGPVLEEVAKTVGSKAKIAKIDIEQEQKTVHALKVSSVPTMVLFKDGKEVGRLVGLRDAGEIELFINKAL